MPTRRKFIAQTTLGAAALATGAAGCQPSGKPAASGPLTSFFERITGSDAAIPGQLLGPNQAAGHRFRDGMAFPQPTKTSTTDVLIVGGGVAGLSARRWLHKQGVRDVLLLELEEQVGGNAAHGRNTSTAYPWGAHYLPIADPTDHELIDFLTESRLITGFDRDLPIYDDYALCHDPEERLFLHGRWQEGLVPSEGIAEADKAQIARFFALIDTLKKAIGTDGNPAFAIPLDRSSADPAYRQLDAISFATYLDQQGFTSTYLRWYLAYCCKDDYGSLPEQTSAWAGLHYFAARRGQAANANSSAVLTWPEGNGFLADQLRQQGASPIQSQALVYALQRTQAGFEALVYDTRQHTTARVLARQVILAIPQFVAVRLLAQLDPDRAKLASAIHYAPWLVANLTVTDLAQAKGMPLCWDNVLYGADSVGYIVANHQHLTDDPQRVLTCYRPLCHAEPAVARRLAYETAREVWLSQLLDELETAHPGLRAQVQQADVWVWGHGMVSPTPGYIWGATRTQLRQPITGGIVMAHSDLSGVSIFEEAFHQGILAASHVLTQLA
ncbi:hypothetical protein FAES_5108 [Fibrella aestuarina BUZ 2]|uniref:Uncharacterized protein n=1 Tax=Fibrella aestuarina BUZ 2 TaxID=1166018 RepID=I0KG54_9BACT|nr:FAD-dependent oxidoreductase [Fibrella aestuarina]CCH03107.1 hypothetical protein FAES_5108 [Fibrella aestuarina BUZ 2]